jgi:hypothetical protein
MRYGAAHPDELPETWDDLPRVFTNEFKAMLRVWGALSELVSSEGHTRSGMPTSLLIRVTGMRSGSTTVPAKTTLDNSSGRSKRGGAPGRIKGSLNTAMLEAKQFCASIVDDPVYQETLRDRAINGKLSPAIECLLWHYARSVPKQTVAVEGTPWAVSAVLADSLPMMS